MLNLLGGEAVVNELAHLGFVVVIEHKGLEGLAVHLLQFVRPFHIPPTISVSGATLESCSMSSFAVIILSKALLVSSPCLTDKRSLLRIPSLYLRPVHNLPEGGEVGGAAVLVVEVVGVFPDVEGEYWLETVCDWVIGVGVLGDG